MIVQGVPFSFFPPIFWQSGDAGVRATDYFFGPGDISFEADSVNWFASAIFPHFVI